MRSFLKTLGIKFNAIWKDSVWSKIIAVSIISLVVFLWSTFISKSKQSNENKTIKPQDNLARNNDIEQSQKYQIDTTQFNLLIAAIRNSKATEGKIALDKSARVIQQPINRTVESFSNSATQYKPAILDLQNLCQLSLKDFETAVLKRGFYFVSETSTEYVKMFNADKKESNGSFNSISRTYVEKSMPIAAFSTTDKQYYLNLKINALSSKNGWSFINEESQEISGKQSLWYHYTNGTFHVALYSFNIGLTDPTWYCVQCYKER